MAESNSKLEKLAKLAKLVRYFILESSTQAGSGHPTSSLSATDLMTVLLFDGYYRFDLKNPKYQNNDRLIFSKGHASPLFYSMYAAASAITEDELNAMRKFGSRLEGHPTLAFPFTEAATGSLGQGLSIGVGMAINAKYLDKLSYKTYVLLGDSEMAEGSVWEAIASAAYYKLDNLVAILDVNRLGQRGQTMFGHDTKAYQKRVSSFGWETIVIDGHDMKQIQSAFKRILNRVQDDKNGKPTMIIAKTIKGKGISFLENQEGKHGVALKPEEFEKAKQELGQIDSKLRGKIVAPKPGSSSLRGAKATKQSLTIIRDRHNDARDDDNDSARTKIAGMTYSLGDMVATRKAYGNALARIFPKHPEMVVLDAEVSNSTYSEIFKKQFPERFFEMFIAEQNMVGVALGLSRRGKIPFISTFAAFFTRAFDQIRMSQYSDGNIKFCGSHAGVSIGEDGASQMGLEDIALFRTILDSVIFYPSDAVSAEKLVELAAKIKGNVYIRTTRADTPVLYTNREEFKIGGSKILKQSTKDIVTVIGAGITLHESLKAYEKLIKENIHIRVVDLYSIKPLDLKMLKKCSFKTRGFVVAEDHHHEGGISEAILHALQNLLKYQVPVKVLSVTKMPKSGKTQELLNYEGIDAAAIIKKVKELIKK